MARTVADAAVLLTAMAGVDPRDAADQAIRRQRPSTTRRRSTPDALKGRASASRAKRYFGYSPPPIAVIDAAIAVMKAQGAVIVDPADIPTAATTRRRASSRSCSTSSRPT